MSLVVLKPHITSYTLKYLILPFLGQEGEDTLLLTPPAKYN